MNTKLNNLFLLSLFALTSCGESSITSFKEQDDYVFDPALYVEYFHKAKENIISKYVEPATCDASYQKTIDPLSNSSIFTFGEESNPELYITYTSILFKKVDGYTVHTYDSFLTEIYVSFDNIDDGFKFGKTLNNENFKRPFGSVVSSISNGDINAYNIGVTSFDYETGVDGKELMKQIFYLLYKVEDLKYDIYFNEDNIFMMPKDLKFNRKYIEYFVKEKDIHYFDFASIDEYITKNNVVID